MTLPQFLRALDTLSKAGDGFKPHKYLMLLAVIDLIQSGTVTTNQFRYDKDLLTRFSGYFAQYHSDSDRDRPLAPFFHLRSSGFWHLHPRPGREPLLANLTKVGSVRDIQDNVAYASLSESIYMMLRDPASASAVKTHICTLLRERLGDVVEERRRIGEDGSEYVARRRTSLFEHEQRAIDSLERGIRGFGSLVANREIYDSQSNAYYEYDVILTSRSGLYVIELKHWSGHIQVSPNYWLLDSYRHRRDPHLTNSYKCRLLRGLCERRFPTFDVWVESVVVLTNPDAVVENAHSPSAVATDRRYHNLTFASLDDFVSFLRKRDGSPEYQLLSKERIAAISEYIRSLSAPPRTNAYKVPGFETVQFLYQRPERIELVARPEDGQTRGLKRFRIFRLPEGGTIEERSRARRIARNTIEAVDHIGEHPYIHRVWTIPNDEGDIIEGSDWSEAGTLADLLADEDSRPTVEESLAICRGIALGLAAAHRANIIHRAVKPAHVLMMNGIPKLTDFDLSFRLDRRPGDATVLPSPDGLEDDGYTAPELLAAEDIDESTDLFGLAVIAYQLLTGEKPFRSTREWAARGGLLDEGRLRRLRDSGASERVVQAITEALTPDRSCRPRSAEEMAEVLAAGNAVQTAPLEPNPYLEPGARYDVYEIIELIGEGSEAQVYCAHTIRGERVALKLFNREVPRERIFQEQTLASEVVSDHVVRCDGRMGHWAQDRYFLVLEHVQGETLRDRIDRGEKPATDDAFRQVALDLMEGLEAFHAHLDERQSPAPLVHGDVKPDNILITPDGRVKLTDVSVAGPPRIDEFAGTTGYVPPDRIVGAQMQFSPDGDLFALGVSLWEWCFGAKPYDNPIVGDAPALPADRDGECAVRRLEWLKRAVATRESERFSSVREMRGALLGDSVAEEVVAIAEVQEREAEEPPACATVGLPDGVSIASQDENIFVAYLNTLSNASAGNENATAEAQGANPLFDRIHVANGLAQSLWQELNGDEARSVILTGNAGDGKTTIASEMYRGQTGSWMPPERRVDIPGTGIVIVKDMSELPAEERAHVLEEAAHSRDQRFLIVTNTGTLLESARLARIEGVDPAGIESEILKALEKDDMESVLDGRFGLLNVGRTDSIGTACAVFRRMLESANWEACGACRLSERCPLYRNVRLLQDQEETVIQRVELVYRRLYEYGVRLTMRQMTGHLAYALTAGRRCAELQALSDIALDHSLTGSLFFNRFFGDDGDALLSEAVQLHPIRYIREAEFGVELDPAYERLLWTREDAQMPLAGEALAILQCLKDRSEHPSAAVRQQVRRLVYFFGLGEDEAWSNYLSTFLRSPMLLDYLKIARGCGPIPSRWEVEHRCRVMQVLQEYFTAVRLPEGSWDRTDRLYITLNQRDSGSATQVVLASFSTDAFRIVADPGHRRVPGSSRRLVLVPRDGSEPRMLLDLPLLDYVAQRYRGEIAAQLSPFYADRLERFESALLSRDRGAADDDRVLHLLRIGSDRRLHPVTVEFSNGRMEVVS